MDIPVYITQSEPITWFLYLKEVIVKDLFNYTPKKNERPNEPLKSTCLKVQVRKRIFHSMFFFWVPWFGTCSKSFFYTDSIPWDSSPWKKKHYLGYCILPRTLTWNLKPDGFPSSESPNFQGRQFQVNHVQFLGCHFLCVQKTEPANLKFNTSYVFIALKFKHWDVCFASLIEYPPAKMQ